MKTTAVLALTLFGACALCARAAVDRVALASSGRSPSADDLTLFPFDDVTIPWRNNLKVTMVPPAKYAGNPVFAAGPAEAPDGYGTKLYGSVIRQGGRLRMWYLACPRKDGRIPGDAERMQNFNPVAYAESTDGIHWVRPNLGMAEFRGNRHNNLVLIEPTREPYSRCYDFLAVYYDPSDPNPDQRYKMAYKTWDIPHGESSPATCVSPDGLRWRLANTRMFSKGLFENTSIVKYRGLYYMAGQNFPPFDASDMDGSPAGRVMKVFFSPDFRHWSEERAMSFYRTDYVPAAEHFGQETHMGAGLWDRGNVILGMYGRWHGNDLVGRPDPAHPFPPTKDIGLDGKKVGLKGLTIDLGFVVSNDAIHYREPVRNYLMVPHGGPGDRDATAILQANAFANTATKTYIWYSHSDIPNADIPGHLAEPPLPAPLPAATKPPAVGLLTLPRDRFGYFGKLMEVSQDRNPAYDEPRDASCLTQSFELKHPSRLYINVDAVSPRAALAIALVDDAERPLPGYTAEITASSLKALVTWPDGRASLPVDAPFRIKVIWPVGVAQATLYAMYIERD